MTTGFIAANIGAAVTLALGLLGLLAPGKAAKVTNLQPLGKTGTSEIRATYGGFFAALGALCLVSQAPPIWLATGLAWLGAAAGRALSVAVDRNRDPKNLVGIAFEAIIGLLLLSYMVPG